MSPRIWILLLSACGADSSPGAPAIYDVEEESNDRPAAKMAPSPAAESAPRGGFGGHAEGAASMRSLGYADGAADEAPPPPAPDDGKGGQAEAPARSWFPESFLFAPLVVTDASGQAELAIRVPDRLTTWRVLGLAHSRDGGQAGAVSSFLGTLPVYVDPVVPRALRTGDRLRLPVQVVNTTKAPVEARLDLTADNGLIRGGGNVRVAAQSATVLSSDLVATGPGTLRLRAGLSGKDAVIHDIPVSPVGRPIQLEAGGTLAGPRTVKLAGITGADPATARVRLVAFPGALAVLRGELTRAGSSSDLADTAQALSLAGHGGALLSSLGVDPTVHAPEETAPTELLRNLGLKAAQRAVRHARAPGVDEALILAPAALSVQGNAVMTRLGERLAAQIARDQRPDGTWEGGSGWTLQRVLVLTADATRAMEEAALIDTGDPLSQARRARAASATRIRAGAAFLRHAGRVEEAYTAAAILASGAVDGTLRDELRKRVRDAIIETPDGGRALPVPEDTVRADGRAPAPAAATALAALALADDPEAAPWLADLGATVLGAWRPGSGWGDGRADLLCLQATLQLFKAPIPAEVQVTLRRDGQVVGEGVLSPGKSRDLLVIDTAAGSVASGSTWQIEASPAVPGLGYALKLTGWAPWTQRRGGGGIELDLEQPSRWRVGVSSSVVATIAAPAGVHLHLRQELPAGVQADEDSLERLIGGPVTSWNTEEGAVELDITSADSGLTTLSWGLVPTLAGALSSGAIQLTVDGYPDAATLVPTTWRID